MDAESTTDETTPEQNPEENPRRLAAVQDPHDGERNEIAARTGKDPGPKDADGNRSLEGMESTGEDEDELFPAGSLEGDPNLSVAKLLKGKPQTLEVKMKGGSTGLKGGLIDPYSIGRAMVIHEVEKIELVPQREGDPGNRRIVGWTVRQILRPTWTEDLDKAMADPATGLAS